MPEAHGSVQNELVESLTSRRHLIYPPNWTLSPLPSLLTIPGDERGQQTEQGWLTREPRAHVDEDRSSRASTDLVVAQSNRSQGRFSLRTSVIATDASKRSTLRAFGPGRPGCCHPGLPQIRTCPH